MRRAGLPLLINEGRCESGWSPCSLLVAAKGGPPSGGGPPCSLLAVANASMTRARRLESTTRVLLRCKTWQGAAGIGFEAAGSAS
jgi:hypothetical protein